MYRHYSGRSEIRIYFRRKLRQRAGNLHGWSAPIFLAIEGGSVGYQIGGSSTDLVMLFMNDHALQSLLGDKFKLGADASVAGGPTCRCRNRCQNVRPQRQKFSLIRALTAFSQG